MRLKQLFRLFFAMVGIISFALGLGARLLYSDFPYTFLGKLNVYAYKIAAMIMLMVLIEWLLSNKIYKGVRYSLRYMSIIRMLEGQMLDDGLYIERGNLIELPLIKLSFDKGLGKGVLKVKNSIKFNNKLDDIVMSSALGRYVVECHYVSDDGNFYIYELVDSSINYKLEFSSFEEYEKYNKQISIYSIFLDNRSIVKLQHILLVGMTGSGKTYCLYNFLLQFYNREIKYELFYADPKGSSLAVIGQTVTPDRTAIGVEEIIDLLDVFVKKMHDRKAEIKELLKDKLDADYSDFNKSPYIFCFDEYASFAAVLSGADKKTRDKVQGLLSEVILQGRQLGFFMLIIMQKSDANLISTSLRDNIPLKIVLGNSEQQTYITAFGTGVDIPKRHYKVGEGVFTEPVLAPEPRLIQCPYLKFDILEAIKSTAPGV